MNHRCHAYGCDKIVPPKLLMCARHWLMVPKSIQSDIWRNYRTGQEIDKNPSDAYIDAFYRAIEAVKLKEGK